MSDSLSQRLWKVRYELHTDDDTKDLFTDSCALESRVAELEAQLAEYKYTPQAYDTMWDRVKELEAQRVEDREKVATFILDMGLATGHGDTIDDLLSELKAQLKESE